MCDSAEVGLVSLSGVNVRISRGGGTRKLDLQRQKMPSSRRSAARSVVILLLCPSVESRKK